MSLYKANVTFKIVNVMHLSQNDNNIMTATADSESSVSE